MSLNRTSGLILGFGVGIVIAIIIFGGIWMMSKTDSSLIKSQALQEEEEATSVPTQTPAVETATPEPASQDTLVNRMVPSEDKVVNDIQKSLNELYGPKK